MAWDDTQNGQDLNNAWNYWTNIQTNNKVQYHEQLQEMQNRPIGG
jgi:hypothetical protein